MDDTKPQDGSHPEKPSTHAGDSGEPTFTSYFQSLDAKYDADGNLAAPSQRAQRYQPKSFERGKRREGRWWAMVALVLVMVGLGLAFFVVQNSMGPALEKTAEGSVEDALESAKGEALTQAAPPQAARPETPPPKPPPTAPAQPRAAAPAPEPRPADRPSTADEPVDLEPAQTREVPPAPALAPEPSTRRESTTATPDADAAVSTSGDSPVGDDASDSIQTAPSPAIPAPEPVDDDIEPTEDTSPPPPLVVPRKVFAPQPEYPLLAQRSGDEGTVVLTGKVTINGDVRDAKVVESATPRLNRAALEAFRTWQFVPAQRAGQVVESTYRVAFHFTIDASDLSDTDALPTPSTPVPAPTPDPSAPLPYGGDFEPPKRAVTPLPSYPRTAWATGVAGDVVLMVVVDRQGRVTQVDVVKGLPHGISQAAVESVRRWRFQPATRDGQPVTVEHRLTLRFAP